ncbi:membrane protein [Mycobacterium sp. ST-F2]|uniref:rhomboid-like protein n=1 Tax=Mycobacterium sp. ST-F2 TaxID=1490484 RepID=UPI0009388C1C|nr:rhomboid-like protein [Mycobacterium sp. ST-F2]OKH83754.1 membrane protein [Mycobacterium sp. ST-F2]
MWRRLPRVPVTVAYAAVLVVVTVGLATLGPAVHDRVIGYASTNLHNLGEGRVGTLIASALIADDGRFFLWLPGLICLLAVAELLWRSRRLVVVFLVGHIGTTLVIAAGLLVAIELGRLPWSVSRVADVGVSYGVLTVVGALTAVVPARLKPAWLGWWAAGSVAVLVVSDDFTDTGHVIALALGLLISMRLDTPVRWTRGKAVVFGVGVAFGYAVLVHTPELAVVGVPASAVGAALVAMIAGWLSRVKNRVEGLPRAYRKKN